MRRIFNILAKNWPLVILLFIGVFLRFYKFPEYVTFLGDQGRDAIVLKRILTLEHLPAIGAPTSVGQVYLGPFYYYFIAPWLLLFAYNPIGPAVGVLFFSCLYLALNYFIVKELFDKKIALISTLFISFSYVLIELSRFSWNPNLMPLFTLLTVYFFVKGLKTGKWLFYLLFGAFLSFAVQLHYLALFLIPPLGILGLIHLFKNKKHFISNLFNFFTSFFSFGIFSSPLIIFDLRHQFLNTKNFINLFNSSSTASVNKITSLLETFRSLNQFSFSFNFGLFSSSIILLLIIIVFLTLVKKDKPITTFLFIFLSLIIGFSLYSGEKHPHYFGVIYPVYFVIVGYFVSFLFEGAWEKYLAYLFIFAFLFLNFQKYNFLRYRGDWQLDRSKKVAQIIFDNVKKDKYTVTSLPEKYSDSTYRYYLELWEKRPIEKDSLNKADELFVVCEKECRPVINNPQWDIAYFAPVKIVNEWKVDSIKIYKLTR